MLSKSQIAVPLTLARQVSIVGRFRTEWLAAGLLILVAIAATLPLWGRSTYLTGDSYQYLRGALTFSQGHGFRDMSGDPFTFMSPLYPLAVGIVQRLFPGGNIETAARLLSLIGASVAVVAFYRLVRARYAFWVSLTAAFLFALMPLRVGSGLWVLSEGLFLGLLLLGLCLVYGATRRSWVTMASGGMLLGLAYLTRPEAMLSIAVVTLLFWFKDRDARKKLVPFLAAVLVVALPYHAWVYQATGKVSSGRLTLLLAQSESFHDGLGPEFVHSHQVDATGESVQQRAADLSLRGVATRYVYFSRWEANRIVYNLGPYWIVLALLVIGFVVAVTRWRRVLRRITFTDTWQFALLPIVFVLPLLHIEDRYFLIALPVILLWLVLMVASVYEFAKLKVPARWRLAAALIPIGFLALFTFSYIFRLATHVRQDPTLLARQTARWLEAQNLSPAPILSQGPDFAFFANSKHVWMANGEPDIVLNYARHSGANYVFVTSRDIQTPLNDALFGNEDQFPAAVKLLHETTDGSARARLFQLN